MTVNLNTYSLAPPQLQDVPDELPQRHGISLRMLRLDALHPQISGNKWFKLRHNLLAAREQGFSRLLSFGGAYSNHLYALSAAAKLFGFEAVAVLRGELITPLNSTLQFAADQGMHFHPVSRSDYRRRDDPEFIAQLLAQYPDTYVIPEGGANALGMRGCMDIVSALSWKETNSDRRLLTLACGTGTTLSGIVGGAGSDFRVLGFSALKGGGFLKDEVVAGLKLLGEEGKRPWDIDLNAHGRGYGKSDADLETFMAGFSQRTGVELDHVYTGKMMRRLYALIESGQIARGTEIIAVHTGGLR